MVSTRARRQSGYMTETPHQDRTDPEPEPAAEPPRADGVNTANLRDYRLLRRSTDDRKIAGVAGGLARHLNIDPVILRVLFVVLIFFGGAGLVLYGVAWLLVPDDRGKPPAVRTKDSTRNTLLIVGAIVAGCFMIGDSWGATGFPWGLAVVALILFGYLMSRDNAPTSPPTVWPPTGQPAEQSGPPSPPYQYGGRQVGWQPVAPQQAPPAPPGKSGPILFGITLALIAAGLGALGLYDAVADHNVADAAYPALALAVTGAMLVLGSFYGRPGGLVLLGLAASVALAGAAIVNPRYDGDRNLVTHPSSAALVKEHYQVPAGRIELDLTEVSDPEALRGRRIQLDATAGEILVRLPSDLAANVDAEITVAGAITTPNQEEGGFGRTFRERIGSSDDPAVSLQIDVDLGHIEIRQEAA